MAACCRPCRFAPRTSPTVVAVRIPPGVLTPGPNDVQIRVALAHRVDCSIKATYELWALLDPAQTGFVIDSAAAAYAVRSLDDLAAEPAAEDGATHIHVRLAADADPESISRAGRFVDALVRRAGLLRPIVDVGPQEGRGAGMDLVLAAGAAGDALVKDLRVVGRENGVTLARDPATNRLIVVLSRAPTTPTSKRRFPASKTRLRRRMRPRRTPTGSRSARAAASPSPTSASPPTISSADAIWRPRASRCRPTSSRPTATARDC